MKCAINRILARDFTEDVHKYSVDQVVKEKNLIRIEKEQQDGEQGGEWEAKTRVMFGI